MSKFRGPDAFDASAGRHYTMLPWRFMPLDGERYVATNMAGEYLTLARDEVHDFAHGRVTPDRPLYNDLKARHFLIDDDTNVAVDYSR